MILFVTTIFLGAFLLFLVQPIIAKQILPWFGGSAAVWATCMVFFQMTLLVGYAYADLTTRKLTARRQAMLHLGLLAVSLLALPILPSPSWKPAGDENPSWRILGLLVGLLAPYVLTGYFELQIGLITCAVLLLYRVARRSWWAMAASAAVVCATMWGSGKAIDYQVAGSRMMLRNFYSVVKTQESGTPVPFRSMVHGGIMHGGQLLDPEMRLRPSSYFGPDSGYGRMFASLPQAPRKVGVIGLGAGSIIAYGRKGDTFRFYEINPQVVELARREFTFMLLDLEHRSDSGNRESGAPWREGHPRRWQGARGRSRLSHLGRQLQQPAPRPQVRSRVTVAQYVPGRICL